MGKPTLLYHDQESEEEFRRAYERGLESLRELNTALQNLGIDLSIQEMTAIQKSEDFLREAIYQNTPALKTLPLAKDAVLKMIELPEGFTNFKEAAQYVKTVFSFDRVTGAINKQFYVKTDCKISLVDSFEEYLERKFKTYATPEEEALIKAIQEVADKLTKIKKQSAIKTFNNFISNHAGSVIQEMPDSDNFQFNGKAFIKYGRAN